MTLLKGVEVNIKADGTLDVPDEVLAERDWAGGIDPHCLRPRPDRADPRDDGEPARGTASGTSPGAS